jgi:hypothetical protein
LAQFVLGDHLGGRSFDPPIGDAGNPRVLPSLVRRADQRLQPLGVDQRAHHQGRNQYWHLPQD